MSASPTDEMVERENQHASCRAPWNKNDLQQVPYVGPTSLDSPKTADNSPASWYSRAIPIGSPLRRGYSARSNSVSHTPQHSPSCSQDHSVPSPVGRPNSHIPSPLHTSAPYETAIHYQWADRKASITRSLHSDALPLTPPHSLSPTSSKSACATEPLAIPGTMSSREPPSSPNDLHSPITDIATPIDEEPMEVVSNEKKTVSQPFSRRFKNAFKGMFKRDPLDETRFERIKGRHWSEEDY